MLSGIASILFWVTGWKVVGKPPPDKKYIGIVAPHTSMWDYFFIFITYSKFKIRFHWLGKQAFFKGPFAFLFRISGGIPVNRKANENAVDRLIEIYNERTEFVFGLSPEGTRRRVKDFRSGYYFIALGAKIPIQPIAIDYGRKEFVFFDLVHPTGDYEADSEVIKELYRDIKGKYPEKFAIFADE